MLSWLIEKISGLLGGEGTTQIGMGNNSISGVTVGDNASNVMVAQNLHVTNNPAPPVIEQEKGTITFKPTAAEVEILVRLYRSQMGQLNAISFDGGYEVVIDGCDLGKQSAIISQQLSEAIDRLASYRLIHDRDHTDEVFYMTTTGREATEMLIDQLEEGMKELPAIEKQMPDLFAEMRTDVSNAPIFRDVYIKDDESQKMANSPSFVYYRNVIPNLDGHVAFLIKKEQLVQAPRGKYWISNSLARYLIDSNKS